jgi:hypothetical protein
MRGSVPDLHNAFSGKAAEGFWQGHIKGQKNERAEINALKRPFNRY